MLNAALRAPERVITLGISNGAHLGASIQSVADWKSTLDARGIAAWSADMMPKRFFDGAITASAWRWYERQQAEADPDALLQGLQALIGTDLTPRLGEITSPVLLMHPDSSPFIPVAAMAELKNRLPAARLHVIGHAKHGMPFSHAKPCAALLRAFLDEASGAASPTPA